MCPWMSLHRMIRFSKRWGRLEVDLFRSAKVDPGEFSMVFLRCLLHHKIVLLYAPLSLLQPTFCPYMELFRFARAN